MKRTVLLFLLGVTISFLLALGGHWLTYELVSGKGGSYKDDFVTISLIDMFGLLPAMSLLIGAIEGRMQPKKNWWVAGACLIPLFGYILWDTAQDRFVVILLVMYVMICTGCAYIVSRRKYGRKEQV